MVSQTDGGPAIEDPRRHQARTRARGAGRLACCREVGTQASGLLLSIQAAHLRHAGDVRTCTERHAGGVRTEIQLNRIAGVSYKFSENPKKARKHSDNWRSLQNPATGTDQKT